MTTDCGESVGPATATLVSQLSPRSLLHGVSSYVLHLSQFPDFVA